jgi:hypothetical protein
MARRGSNSFRRNDGLRALRIARDGGMEPSAMEIVVGTDRAARPMPDDERRFEIAHGSLQSMTDFSTHVQASLQRLLQSGDPRSRARRSEAPATSNINRP